MIVLIHEPDWMRVRDRLGDAPGWRPLIVSGDGRLLLDGQDVPAGSVEPDAVWITRSVFDGGPVEIFLTAAIDGPAVRWVQTFNAGLDVSFAKMRAYGMRFGAAGERLADRLGDTSIFAAMMAQGRRVSNSDSMAAAIGEYAIAQICAEWYPIAEQRAAQREHRWQHFPFRELAGSRWLVIGFGRNGSEIGRRARALGAVVTGIRRSPAADIGADRVATPAELGALLPDADVVILACPLNAATRDMVGPAFLDRMKPGSILMNIARGGLIDDSALLAALDRGKPRTAILDAFRTEPLPPDDPLWSHPAVRLTAHCSWAGDGVIARNDALFIENARSFLTDGTLRNEVGPADV
jgi:phosphoglycerate dehydrogenase-like enzyme